MKRIIGLVLLIVVLGGVIVYNASQGKVPQDEQTGGEFGMFAWDEGTIEDPASVRALIETLSINRWYQEFPEIFSTDTVKAFVSTLHEEQVQVYSLIGSVEWGYEKDGKSLIKAIRKIAEYNETAEDTEKIYGLMIDVEPYTASKWEKNRKKYMSDYVSGMIKAYQYASRENLRVALCIPRHYDDQGLTDQLEELIAEACDEVAVMDYDCGQEIRKIATEAGFAKKYGKELHCILEFQEVGKHGLTEDKTYRNKGITAAQEVWNLMRTAYPDQEIICDYHWSEPIRQMLKEDEKG